MGEDVRRRGETRGRVIWRTTMIFLGPLLVIGALAFGVRIAFGAIGDAVCADYNSLSNDFCDEWHLDPPPEESFPSVPGWGIERSSLSCGSAGCATRTYILVASVERQDPVAAFAQALERDGWLVQQRSYRGEPSWDATLGDLDMWIQPARAQPDVLVPEQLQTRKHIYVRFSLRSETGG